eukprot:GHUV01002074.1.p1 GENE.GHUV01002074.1~~GHUV01002074.1.p1  ORF type:complete len:233 (+),score=53.81 GHUV01002074.1:154-852(+)
MSMEGVVLKYFDLSGFYGLGGLGGGIRFFFLTNGIKFEDQPVSFDDWKDGLKAAAIKSGESITGHLPVVTMNGKHYVESNSILRLLSRKLGQYGEDPEQDYVIDMIADILMDFRKAWGEAAVPQFTGEPAPAKTERYLTSADQRKHFYHTLNTLIAQHGGSGTHVIGSKPTFVDAVLFCMLWDDVAIFKGDEYLWIAAPHLEAFFQAYLQQEGVFAWCDKMRPDMVEGIKSG